MFLSIGVILMDLRITLIDFLIYSIDSLLISICVLINLIDFLIYLIFLWAHHQNIKTINRKRVRAYYINPNPLTKMFCFVFWATPFEGASVEGVTPE